MWDTDVCFVNIPPFVDVDGYNDSMGILGLSEEEGLCSAKIVQFVGLFIGQDYVWFYVDIVVWCNKKTAADMF